MVLAEQDVGLIEQKIEQERRGRCIGWSDLLFDESLAFHEGYLVTNENVNQILAALDLQGHETVGAILGAGDQALGILGKLTQGKVHGIDINKHAILMTGLKAELLHAHGPLFYHYFCSHGYSSEMYGEIAQITGDITKQDEELGSTVWRLASSFSPYRLDVKGVQYLRDAEALASIRENLGKLTLTQANVFAPLSFRDNSFDVLYLSNVLDYCEFYNSYEDQHRFFKELSRVLIPGGMLYASTKNDPSFLCCLESSFIRDNAAYERGLVATKLAGGRGALGSPLCGWGDFFVGVNAK